MVLTFPQEIVPLGTQKREDTVSVSHNRRPLDPHYVSVNENNLHEYLSLKQTFKTLRDILIIHHDFLVLNLVITLKPLLISRPPVKRTHSI